MRWFVGDLQGCAREFDALLSEIRFDPARDEVWCLGDLVNRGPDSLRALRLWRQTGGRGVLGNHDVHALETRSGRRAKPMPSLDELFAAPDCDALLDAVRVLPALVHFPADGDGPEVWAVHGGLHPLWDDLHDVAVRANAGPFDDARLQRPEIEFAISARCCTKSGERSSETGPPDACRAPFYPWDRFYRGRALVVHGHWASRGFYRGERTLGLDSGCVYGGSLTAWCQQEDRIVQVEAR